MHLVGELCVILGLVKKNYSWDKLFQIKRQRTKIRAGKQINWQIDKSLKVTRVGFQSISLIKSSELSCLITQKQFAGVRIQLGLSTTIVKII